MNLYQPISSNIPTLDGPVLQVLAGTTRPLTGREVHKLAGTGSEQGVRDVLTRLVSEGIVVANRQGAAIFYAANRTHLAWPAVEALASLRLRLLTAVKQQIKSWSIAPIHASFFGSFSRSEGNVDSDIDILIIRPDGILAEDPKWEQQLDQLRESVNGWIGNQCQIFEIDLLRLAEYIAVHDPLVEAWLSDGLYLAGAQLKQLINTKTVR